MQFIKKKSPGIFFWGGLPWLAFIWKLTLEGHQSWRFPQISSKSYEVQNECISTRLREFDWISLVRTPSPYTNPSSHRTWYFPEMLAVTLVETTAFLGGDLRLDVAAEGGGTIRASRGVSQPPRGTERCCRRCRGRESRNLSSSPKSRNLSSSSSALTSCTDCRSSRTLA